MSAPTQEKLFRNQSETDTDSRNAQLIRDTYWAMFSMYAHAGVEVEDFDGAVARLQSVTGWPKAFVTTLILGHAALQELPKLRDLQSRIRILDSTHLSALHNGIEELGPDPDRDVLAEIDASLVAAFTPRRHNQAAPGRGIVTKRIREIIKRRDPSRAYNEKKRRKRETETTDKLTFDEFYLAGVARSRIEMLTNAVQSARIHANIVATARENGLSMAETAQGLLAGELAPATTRPVVHVYSPKGRADGDPVYLPGHGWTDAEATAAFEEWIAGTEPQLHDLDEAATQTTRSYVPTEDIRQAVIARDGTCIFPGCTRPGHQCQLDHRIPFGEGGETSADNLYLLCQTHHNVKTDRRAFYFPDPHTGDIIWIFADGTWSMSASEGVLYEQITPTNPRWRSNLTSVRQNRAKVAEFHAKCHRVMDEFDKDLDEDKATAAIEALEEESGLSFPFRPEPPYVEPLPPEPDFEEPPFPDPEDYRPYNPKHPTRLEIERTIEFMRRFPVGEISFDDMDELAWLIGMSI